MKVSSLLETAFSLGFYCLRMNENADRKCIFFYGLDVAHVTYSWTRYNVLEILTRAFRMCLGLLESILNETRYVMAFLTPNVPTYR